MSFHVRNYGINTFFAVVSVLKFIRSDFIKNAGKLFGSTGITQLIAFFTIPFLSRLFVPELHGDFAAFLSVVSVGVAFSTLKYEQAIMVEDDRTQARNLVKLSLLINLGVLGVVTGLIFIFPDFVSQLFGRAELPKWILLVPLCIFLTGIGETLVVWWNRDRKYNRLSMNRILSSLTGSGYKLLHGFVKPTLSNGLIVGHLLGQLVRVVHYIPKNIGKHLTIDKQSLKTLAAKYKNFPFWSMPSTLVNVIGANMPVFIIGYFLGREMNGYFGNAMKLTYIPLSAVGYAISQVYYERLARLKTSNERYKLSANILRFIFLLSCLPVAILMIWGDVITPFILGNEWASAGLMVQIIVLFYFVMALSSPFAAAFEVYDRLDLQFIYTAIFLVITGASLYASLMFFEDIYIALMAFSFAGIIVRLTMLHSCFKLIGSSIFVRIITGIVIIALLTGGLFLLRQVTQ